VRMALADCIMDGGDNAPEIDPDWGEPGLTPSEKVFGWCSFEVLAFTTGNPENPVNAIPPKARATCQIRFVVGVDPENFMPALPRAIVAEVLGRPTVWVPHSYASCSQHAPNEHLLAPVAREALQVMTGIYWDLGEAGVPGG